MLKRILTAAVLLTLAACDGGGGGGGQVDDRGLPESNNVDPTPRPDTYIDRRNERKYEARDRETR